MSRKASKRPVSYAESLTEDGGDDSEADLSGSADSSSDDDLSLSEDDSPPKKSKKAATPTKSTAKAKPTAKSSTPSKAKKEPATGKKSGAVSGNAAPQNTGVAPSSSSSASVLPTALPTTKGGVVDITQGPPVTTDAAAKKLLLQYMTVQNRPYSLLQVFENLHKRIPKATMERVLTTLSGPGAGLICKEYGKAKIYFVDQSTLACDYTPEELQSLIEQNEERKERTDELATEEKSLKTQLAKFKSEPTDCELDQVLAEMEERVASKRDRVASLTSSNTFAAEPKALQSAIKKFNFFRQSWQQRRSQCMETVDSLSDAMNKKRKDILADICIETDEDVGQSLPAVLKEPPASK